MSASTPRRIVIVGAGGFGREVFDIVDALRNSAEALEFVGFVDDGDVDIELLINRGAPWLGPTDALSSANAGYVIGIGSGIVRRRLASGFDATGFRPLVLVHPAATVGGQTRLGSGTIVAAGSRVTTNVSIGAHVDLHVNSTVGHDSRIGDFVSVFPGATVSGGVTLGEASTVGTGANVLPGITVGNEAMIGAGAVVTRDVAPGAVVAGSPAKPLES